MRHFRRTKFSRYVRRVAAKHADNVMVSGRFDHIMDCIVGQLAEAVTDKALDIAQRNRRLRVKACDLYAAMVAHFGTRMANHVMAPVRVALAHYDRMRSEEGERKDEEEEKGGDEAAKEKSDTPQAHVEDGEKVSV